MPLTERGSRAVARLMLLYAGCSSLFGLSYVLGRPPAWTSFALHQAEGLLFLGAALVAPRLSPGRRPLFLSIVYVLGTALIIPAAHLAGEDPLYFLSVLPLLIALTNPEHPLPVFATGVACVVGSAALLFAFGPGAHPGYQLATALVIVAGATYGVWRLVELRHELEEVRGLQSALVQKERLAALGEAAAVVAHEVRNPLGAIANASALIRRLEVPAAGGLLGMIDDEVVRLDRLVNDLLVVARPLLAKKRVIELGELIRRCAQLACGGEETSLRRVVFTEPSMAPASADPELLQLAVVNLLRNALQASPQDASILITLGGGSAESVIGVEDEGPGLPPEVRERLFEPFATTRSAGTGLGLAVAKRVVEAHSGTLLATSRTSGRGTRFEIRLPTGPAEPADV